MNNPRSSASGREEAGYFLPRNSRAILQSRTSSRFRESLLKPYVSRNFNQFRRFMRGRLTTHQNEFVKFQGVSLYYLNQFWKDIKSGTKFPDVKLFTVSDSRSTVMWEEDNPKRRKGNIAICRKSSTIPEDAIREIPINKLRVKERKDWTIADISSYCIYPVLSKREVVNDQIT